MTKIKVKESEERKIKSAQKVSVAEGASSSVMSGAGDAYVPAYALAMNASNAEIGFLSSSINLFNAFAQLVGSRLTYKFSRKRLVLFAVTLHALMWLPIIFVGYLYAKGIMQNQLILLLIVFYCVLTVSGSLGGPAWFSWMGDIVKPEERGKYFSWRNKIGGLTAMFATLIAAFFLDHMEAMGQLILGFGIIFFFAFLGRAIAAILFVKMYEPQRKIEPTTFFSFKQFITKAPSNNYGKFAIYVGMINFATHFASPFFAVYMLNELGFSYTWFTAVNVAGSLFTIIAMPLWGKIGDYYGNKTLLTIGSIIVPITPLFWLVSGNPIYLILTAQLSSGFGWAAFNLAASNYIYDAVTPERRSICVAYFTMINGISIFIGASLGGLVAEHLKLGWINIFLFIFLVSGILRAIAAIIMIPQLKEVRNIPKNQPRIPFSQYLYLITPRPLFGMYRGVKSLAIGMTDIAAKGKKGKSR